MTLDQFFLTTLWQDLFVENDIDGDPIVNHGYEGRRVVTTPEAIESWLATNPPITEAGFFEGVDYWGIVKEEYYDEDEDEEYDEDEDEEYDEDEEDE